MKHRLALFAALFVASPAAAVTLEVRPSTLAVTPGGSVSVELVASGLAATGVTVGDFDVDLTFDPAFLTVTNFGPSDVLGSVAAAEAIDLSLGETAMGTINLAALSLLEEDSATCIFCLGPYLVDLQGDTIVLGSVTFQLGALAVGAPTEIGVGAVNSLGDGAGSPLTIDAMQSGQITAVPEPGTAVLLGGSLLLLSGRRRKR